VKYLTKEWYELCQQTGLHYGLRAHKGATVLDEALYTRLYKRKEKEFIDLQREIYNVDPRIFLEQDGMNLVPLHNVFNVGEIVPEDRIEHRMSDEERAKIKTLIAEYDAKPPFDEVVWKQGFRDQLDWKCNYAAAQLPQHILSQIADLRVYALGYCTKDVLHQLKILSRENQKKVDTTMEEAVNVLRAQEAI
jgi:hypothetical protein